ncbi:MAG: adenylate kinase [Candidatus Ancillula sp.]|jgi:adenylate kinase|nr:adenylate kinase [Candidatus Ancillula sp.]
MHLLIMGPQGVGKGTQAVRLGQHYGIQNISTGDIFRYNIKRQTELGKKVKAVIDAGELVTDELTGELVRDVLCLENAREGFILDGYPRNHNQVIDLDATLDEFSLKLDAAISLTADREELVERMLKRAEIEGRDDDTPDAINKRLEIYDTQTAPLVNHYRTRGLLLSVDGIGSVEDITNRIIKELDAFV